MHRKVRQYLKKSLCGILSAAMILTSLSVPDMTVRAAEVSVSDETEIPDETKISDETKVSDEAVESDEIKESDGTEESGIKSTDEVNESSTDEDVVETSDSDSSEKSAKDGFNQEEEAADNDGKELNEEADANTAQNVTLHIYSEKSTIALSVGYELTIVGEDGSISKITPSFIHSEWGKNYYDMQAESGGWHCLTFIVPDGLKAVSYTHLRAHETGT